MRPRDTDAINADTADSFNAMLPPTTAINKSSITSEQGKLFYYAIRLSDVPFLLENYIRIAIKLLIIICFSV